MQQKKRERKKFY